jgi:hypothetical protein
MKDQDLENFPFAYVNAKSQPVLVIRARNVGRSPISVESVEIVNTHGNAIPYIGEYSLGKYLPHSLQPGTSEYWPIDLEGVMAVSEGDGQTHLPLSVRAQVKLANNKKKKTNWIKHSTLIAYKAFAQKLSAFLDKRNID